MDEYESLSVSVARWPCRRRPIGTAFFSCGAARSRVPEEESMETVADPISQPRAKRLYRTVAERRRIVEETFVPGVLVATVARAHGVNANQVFRWRKLYQAGLLEPLATDASAVRLLPVTVSSDLEPAEPAIPLPPIKKEVDDVQPRTLP